jgi:hypothetical protein
MEVVIVVGAELAVRISLVLVLPEMQQSAKMVLVQMRVWPPQQHTPLRSLHGMRWDTSCTPRNRKEKEREKEKGAALSVSLRHRERAAPYLLFPSLWTAPSFCSCKDSIRSSANYCWRWPARCPCLLKRVWIVAVVV